MADHRRNLDEGPRRDERYRHERAPHDRTPIGRHAAANDYYRAARGQRDNDAVERISGARDVPII